MNVLLVGGGGREHAMAWKLAQSPRLKKLYAAPGNPGIAHVAECVDISADDIDGLLGFATREGIDLTVVGPEAPLAAGIADRFADAGLKLFGPSGDAARLEGSKAFSKEIMARFGVPTAASRAFTESAPALEYLRELSAPYVVKADGLAAGKGVIIAENLAHAEAAVREILDARVFGEAGARVVIEEFLDGEEASYLAFSDGKTIVPMVTAQDHKRIFDGDRGPNTGGMGAYSPAPVMTPEREQFALEKVMRPVIDGMREMGTPFTGILYAGLMITADGIKVLEFNCRFGDPETQPILSRLDSDLLEIFDACAHGTLDKVRVKWSDDAAVCVVIASSGYPETATKGSLITGIEDAEQYDGVMVFHAGTAIKNGKLVTAGGRVLGVTARAATIRKAIDLAYNATGRIRIEGGQFRRDIGAKAARHGAGKG
ncbi:MAG: phosphoribosylamine--glycine ligase [Nitrospirota bacterium]|nr:phosphoribosylamine--glycine ligase [Nitrospirota bacterium]